MIDTAVIPKTRKDRADDTKAYEYSREESEHDGCNTNVTLNTQKYH